MNEMANTEYYCWPHVGWWEQKESIAWRMTWAELEYARSDCFEAAKANLATEGKYMDELSIYANEMRKRS